MRSGPRLTALISSSGVSSAWELHKMVKIEFCLPSFLAHLSVVQIEASGAGHGGGVSVDPEYEGLLPG